MRKKTVFQQIIDNLVTVPKGNPRFWAKETKLAKQLIESYGEAFMLWVKPREGYKSPSLAFFKTPAGKNYLSDQLFEYKKASSDLQQKEQIVLADAKVGEDIQIEKKPRTLKEFLEFYGKRSKGQQGQD